MHRLSIALVCVLVAATSLPAQGCTGGTLTMSAHPNTGILEIDLAGAPDGALTFLAFGNFQGTTTYGNNLFTLGLSLPFDSWLIGATDANGDLNRRWWLLPFIPPGQTIHWQAVSVDVFGGNGSVTIDFCTSNVSSLTF